MRFTVVRKEKEESNIEVLSFENKRSLQKWIKEIQADINPSDYRAGQSIHVDAQGAELIIFKGDPVALHVRTERQLRLL